MIFRYFSTLPGPNGGTYNFPFEHPATSMDTLSDRLAEDGHLLVDKLFTADDGKGSRWITRRDRVIIGTGGIGTITPEANKYREPAVAAAA